MAMPGQKPPFARYLLHAVPILLCALITASFFSIRVRFAAYKAYLALQAFAAKEAGAAAQIIIALISIAAFAFFFFAAAKFLLTAYRQAKPGILRALSPVGIFARNVTEKAAIPSFRRLLHGTSRRKIIAVAAVNLTFVLCFALYTRGASPPEQGISAAPATFGISVAAAAAAIIAIAYAAAGGKVKL